MTKTYPGLPNWHFEIEETSAGVYEVVANDRWGQRYRARGTDPDSLLVEARAYAAHLQESQIEIPDQE